VGEETCWLYRRDNAKLKWVRRLMILMILFLGAVAGAAYWLYRRDNAKLKADAKAAEAAAKGVSNEIAKELSEWSAKAEGEFAKMLDKLKKL
jgi:flagellar basal body-associated protein FliL